MFVNTNEQIVFHAEFIGIFMANLQVKFHMPCFNGSMYRMFKKGHVQHMHSKQIKMMSKFLLMQVCKISERVILANVFIDNFMKPII
jgi:hypothetical protein